jgi:hypothetical protein
VHYLPFTTSSRPVTTKLCTVACICAVSAATCTAVNGATTMKSWRLSVRPLSSVTTRYKNSSTQNSYTLQQTRLCGCERAALE